MSDITNRWVNILIPFTNKYSDKISGTELARKVKVPQQTVSRYMNNLIKDNLIKYEIKGRNKHFYFDFKKQTTKIVFELIENEKSLNFQLKLKEAGNIINELLVCCESLIVFGSYSSMTFHKDSDLDILILGKYDKKKIDEVKRRQIIQINEHYSSYVEFSRLLNKRNNLSIGILKNHTLFGNVSKMVNIFLKFSVKLFI